MAPLTRIDRADGAQRRSCRSSIVALVIAALLIARYNVRAKRADRRGAARLALFVMTGYAGVLGRSPRITCRTSNTEMNSFMQELRHACCCRARILWDG